MMKIAVSGKGGVGKTTFSALLIRALNKNGKHVLAIDADPDANLAAAIGIKGADKIVPIAEMKDLIFERTEAQPGTIGGFFKLNPKVDDLPEALSARFENIKLMRLGGVKKGGSGCICPESTLLKALVTHVVLSRDEVVVMDMEAGIEHLGRATAQAVDKLFIVVEPGRRSIETAGHIKKLASEIGLKNLSLVGNKIRSDKDMEFLKENLPGFEFSCFIPYDDALIEADLNGISPFDNKTSAIIEIEKVIAGLTEK
ncbi:AAA family ATPase [Desulfobacterium sp. N47]|uniref:ATP-binding protein n=1 Tax=Desulfobacterium sp. N47 TaxID=3115210 RepID=UPI003C9C12C8